MKNDSRKDPIVPPELAGRTAYRQAIETCCPIVELRQYTLYPGKRDILIDLFDREFVESQEAVGMSVIGQFRDRDNPDRFVWLRGFQDMASRAEALKSFYLDGVTWKAHRDEANATMIDSSNVLLLRPIDAGSGFPSPNPKSMRPPVGTTECPSSLILTTIYYLDTPVDDEFSRFFVHDVKPAMVETGAQPLACFKTEPAENSFPALPVRAGENVFVWFAAFANLGQYDEHVRRLEQSRKWKETMLPELLARLKSPPEQLRLEPTARSQLR